MGPPWKAAGETGVGGGGGQGWGVTTTVGET